MIHSKPSLFFNQDDIHENILSYFLKFQILFRWNVFQAVDS